MVRNCFKLTLAHQIIFGSLIDVIITGALWAMTLIIYQLVQLDIFDNLVFQVLAFFQCRFGSCSFFLSFGQLSLVFLKTLFESI
jgi:hypothetical protein